MSPTPPVEAAAIAAALMLLALAGFFARLVRGTGPSRLRRVLIPAVFFILGAAIVFGFPLLAFMPPSIMLRAFGFGMLWLVPIALISISVLDGAAVAMGAERTPGWLQGGILGAIIVTYAWLFALTGDLFLRAEPIVAAPALIAAASAIIWWPYLPRPESDPEEEEGVTEIFE